MSLFTKTIDVSVQNPQENLVEKNVYQIGKSNVELRVAAGCEALLGAERIEQGQTRVYSRKVVGDPITVFVYPRSAAKQIITIPFWADQHTISLDVDPTAKVEFALVGVARVNVADLRRLALFFNKTVTAKEVEETLIQTLKPTLTSTMTAAARSHINSATTDVSIYAELRDIAKDGMSNNSLRGTLMDMGLILMPGSIDLRLNPIGESKKVIDEINRKFNEKALNAFDEEKEDKKRKQEIEDDLRAKQHEINLINAQNTDTHNNNYTYNGKPPVRDPEKKKEPAGPAYCPSCGNKVEPGDAYCSICGRKLK